MLAADLTFVTAAPVTGDDDDVLERVIEFALILAKLTLNVDAPPVDVDVAVKLKTTFSIEIYGFA